MPSLAPPSQFVFAYGSLVDGGDGVAAQLSGHRRAWTVAMDNRQSIPGYKRYVDPVTGLAPAAFIAFLDLVPSAGCSLNGRCLPVTDGQLAALDRRERNYERVDVSDLVPGAGGRVWTYRGSAAGRARARAGRDSGSLLVVKAYAEAVHAGFAALGEAELRRFVASTDPPGCPVADLRREDLPPGPAAPVSSG